MANKTTYRVIVTDNQGTVWEDAEGRTKEVAERMIKAEERNGFNVTVVPTGYSEPLPHETLGGSASIVLWEAQAAMDTTQMLSDNTFTVYEGFEANDNLVATYKTQRGAEKDLGSEIVRYESREVSSEEYAKLFDPATAEAGIDAEYEQFLADQPRPETEVDAAYEQFVADRTATDATEIDEQYERFMADLPNLTAA